MQSHNEWYDYYLRTGGNSVIIDRNDPFIQEITRRDNIREGRPPDTQLTDRRIRHWMYRFSWEADRWGTSFQDVMPLMPTPEPIPPVILGDWKSHFLSANWFFGPAVCGRNVLEQNAYFDWLVSQNYNCVNVNPDQADWGPSKGHPEWTAGGWDIYHNNTMEELLDIITRARSRQLQVALTCVDQDTLLSTDLDRVIQMSQFLVDNTWKHTCLYMLSWELDEVWTSGIPREPNIERWIQSVDWNGRDVGIHYANGLGGGLNFYSRLNQIYPDHVVRLTQYRFDASDAELRQWTDRLLSGEPGVARVAAETGTKWCNFEHSSERNTGSSDKTEAEVIRRRSVIMDAAAGILSVDRQGFMN